MKRLVFTDKTECRRIQRIIDKAMGLPMPGVQLGGGVKGDVTPLGTLEWTSIKKKRSNNTWDLICDGNIIKISKDEALMSNLNNAQKTALKDCVAAAIDAADDDSDLEDDDS